MPGSLYLYFTAQHNSRILIPNAAALELLHLTPIQVCHDVILYGGRMAINNADDLHPFSDGSFLAILKKVKSIRSADLNRLPLLCIVLYEYGDQRNKLFI